MRRFEEENFNSFEPEEILPSFIELRTDSEKNENFEESDILTKIINDLEKGEITDYLRENYSVTVQRQVGLKISQEGGMPTVETRKVFDIKKINKQDKYKL